MTVLTAGKAIDIIRIAAHDIHQENGKETRSSTRLKESASFLQQRIEALEEKVEHLIKQENQEIKDKAETITELKQRIELELLTNLKLRQKIQEAEQDQYSESW